MVPTTTPITLIMIGSIRLVVAFSDGLDLAGRSRC